MEIRYYANEIRKFIKSLDERSGADIDKLIMLLYKCGNEIRMPYSKSIGNGLFELRKLGKKQIRVIYCFHEGEAIILHIFEKKSNAISNKDLKLAQDRKESLA